MKQKRSFIPAVLWTLLVTILLCIPGREFPKITFLSNIWLDKWVHIALFLVFVISWSWGYARRAEPVKLKNIFLKILLFTFLYSILLELVQENFIPFRSFAIGDIVANGLGGLAGYIYSKWKFIKNKTPELPGD